MRDHIAKVRRHDDSKRMLKQIQRVIGILKRIEANPYFMELHRPFWKKYGKLKMPSKKIPNSNLYQVSFRYPKETPKNAKEIERESARLMNEEKRLRRVDMWSAFRSMSLHMWDWWE